MAGLRRSVILLGLTAFACACQARIGVVVNRDLWTSSDPVRTSVRRYIAALGAANAWADTTTFVAGSGARSELQSLRTALRTQWDQPTDPLTGAVLVGELPTAKYAFRGYEYPIDYYFMNLNAASDDDWKDADGDDVFDGHPATADKTMEIWVSRVMAHNLAYDFWDELTWQGQAVNWKNTAPATPQVRDAWQDGTRAMVCTSVDPDVVVEEMTHEGQPVYMLGELLERPLPLLDPHTAYYNSTHGRLYVWSGQSLPGEAGIIADYFDRLCDRMSAPASDAVAWRSMALGDFKGGIIGEWTAPRTGFAYLDSLGMDTMRIKYPHDTPANWLREVSKGYEIATLFEHAGPSTGSMFAQDQGENNNNSLHGVPPVCAPAPQDRFYLDLLRPGAQGAHVRFFNCMGCEFMNYLNDNSLGQMHAMTGDGLVTIGATTDNHPSSQQEAFVQQLTHGKCAGDAFVYFVNNVASKDYATLVVTLLGAGTATLRTTPTGGLPRLRIASATMTKGEPGPSIHGDPLVLSAAIESDPPGLYDPDSATLTWYGMSGVVSGNNTPYVLDGHNAPMNKDARGEYQVVLHVEQPGLQPASASTFMPGWQFTSTSLAENPMNPGAPARLNRHYKVEPSGKWRMAMRGLTADVGGTQDDFVYYYQPLRSGNFEVVAKVEQWWNSTTAQYDPDAKAGVMIRESMSRGSVQAFVGITRSNGAVFVYRDAPGATANVVRRSGAPYVAGNAWVKVVREGMQVRAYVSTDGIPDESDLFGVGAFSTAAEPLAGFAFACNDPAPWDTFFNQERWAEFGDMKVNILSERQPLAPILHYLTDHDGVVTAYFGYSNPNDFDVIVDEGSANQIAVDGAVVPKAGQPTHFSAGEVHGAAQIVFNGAEIAWTLDDTTVSGLRADARDDLPIIPEFEGVTFNCQGAYTATFGYTSPHEFTVTKRRGPSNYTSVDLPANSSAQETFLPGHQTGRLTVTFRGAYASWHLDDSVVTAYSSDADQSHCPPMRFYKAFAFGADSFTREVPSAPGHNYIKVSTANRQYSHSQGYGYRVLSSVDPTSDVACGALDGNDRIYDQHVGVTGGAQAYAVLRINVPRGAYRFVAAGGHACASDRGSKLTAYAGVGYSGGPYTPILPETNHGMNEFYTVGFTDSDGDRMPPAGDGAGAQPVLLASATSPYVWAEGQLLEFEQKVATGKQAGGDLCLLELWHIPAMQDLHYSVSVSDNECYTLFNLPEGFHLPPFHITTATDNALIVIEPGALPVAGTGAVAIHRPPSAGGTIRAVYPTIQEAMAVVRDDETVEVLAGTYTISSSVHTDATNVTVTIASQSDITFAGVGQGSIYFSCVPPGSTTPCADDWPYGRIILNPSVTLSISGTTSEPILLYDTEDPMNPDPAVHSLLGIFSDLCQALNVSYNGRTVKLGVGVYSANTICQEGLVGTIGRDADGKPDPATSSVVSLGFPEIPLCSGSHPFFFPKKTMISNVWFRTNDAGEMGWGVSGSSDVEFTGCIFENTNLLQPSPVLWGLSFDETASGSKKVVDCGFYHYDRAIDLLYAPEYRVDPPGDLIQLEIAECDLTGNYVDIRLPAAGAQKCGIKGNNGDGLIEFGGQAYSWAELAAMQAADCPP